MASSTARNPSTVTAPVNWSEIDESSAEVDRYHEGQIHGKKEDRNGEDAVQHQRVDAVGEGA